MIYTFEEIIEQLAKIIDELNARETSNNCVWAELSGYSWDELCDKAIELIRELGGNNKPSAPNPPHKLEPVVLYENFSLSKEKYMRDILKK